MQAFCPNCLTTLDDVEAFSCRRCGTAQPPGGVWPKDPLLGELIDEGRFCVEQILGSGGFGKVYRIRHSVIEEEVFALKVLSGAMVGDPASEAEFLQEVRILMGLDHPNIVNCYDVGRLPTGALFIRMELLKGKGVGSAIHPPHIVMPPVRVAKVGAQVASALALVHARGILHRDLKPANILLMRRDDIRVIDFGIAKVLEGQNTQLSRVIGTPDYMAPEQFVPGAAVDGRLDVYQLGAVLFFLLTGRPPYWQGGTQTQQAMLNTIKGQEAHRGGPGPRPSEMRAELADAAPALDVFVAKMLATEAEHRPTAIEVADQLAKLAAGHTELSPMPVGNPPPDDAPTQMMVAPPAPTLRHTGRRLAPHTQRATRPDQKTIAVLPFRLLGPQDDAYIAEGLTEDIIDSLSGRSGLRVRPRGVVMALEIEDPQTAGEALDVEVVVEGSLRRAGDKIQIRARLITVADGFQVWAKRFVCTTEEIFDVSESVASEIGGALEANTLPANRQGVAPSAASVDLFLRARYELRHNWHGDTSSAVDLFDRALELAPDDPLTLAMGAVARARLAFAHGADHSNQTQLALAMAERALHFAPHRCEPYYALGLAHFVLGDTGKSIEALLASRSRSESYAPAHDLLGRILLEEGPLDEAISTLKHTIRLDPNLTNARFDLARGYALGRQWDRAGVLLVTDTEQDLNQDLSGLLRTRFAVWRGAPRDANTADPPKAPEHSIAKFTALYVESIQTRALSPESQAWLQEQLDAPVSTRLKLLFHQLKAEMTAFIGDVDACISALEAAVALGLTDRVWLNRCAVFDGLKDDPRLIALRVQCPERQSLKALRARES